MVKVQTCARPMPSSHVHGTLSSMSRASCLWQVNGRTRVVSQHICGLVVMLVKVSSELNTGMGKVLLAVRHRAMKVFLLLPFTGFEGRRSLIAA